jgi:hypothetical protein|nr:MAG TPA: hypothetical protein [Caudoviricetes sp.]
MITFHTPLETGEFMGIDFQVMADDLSTSAARLVVVGTFISPLTVEEKSHLQDLVHLIRRDGEWNGSYDDQTDYYSWNGHQVAVWGDIIHQAIIIRKTARNDFLNLLS